MLATSPIAYTSVAAGHVRSTLDIEAAPPTLSGPQPAATAGGLDAAAPHHAAGGNDRAVGQPRVAGADLIHADAEMDLYALLVSTLDT